MRLTICHAVRGASLVVLVAAALLPPCAASAADSQATTTQECYRSIRSCQKSRCAKLDGQEQVTCMGQCSREYETCVRGAKSGGTGVNLPRSEATLGAPQKVRRTHVPRHQQSN